MKPQPKKEVAIEAVFELDYQILFFCSPDALEDFREFGRIEKWEYDSNKYWLYVDRRYDLAEVVEYINNYDRKD